jgi:iron complex outermembrane recepter protein
MGAIRNLAIAGVSLLSLSAPALAQNAAPKDQPAAADEAEKDKEIVITGTLIRGIAPGGSQTIDVSKEKITSIGAANTSDLISTIPQAGTFNGFVGVRGSSNFSLAVNRPTLRYLGNTSSSTGSTLLLLDGHRLPGMGILQTSADVDAIAAGAIERVEVVTDGGSSTYGSDAVGGVINFITRKSFDGVEAKANYGIGDSYQQANATITAGKKWDWGSAYVSYDFSRHDELFGADRDWSQSLNWPLTQSTGAPVGSSLNCVPGNVSFSNTGHIYALPGFTASQNRCDNTELATFYPRETKHSVLASLSVDNVGAFSFSLKGYYVHRVDTSDGGPLTADVSVTTASPVYHTVLGESGTESFRLNFGSVLGNSVPQVTRMESYGITPSVKVDLGSNWQVNAFFNYGRGKARFLGGLINTAPLNAAALTGAFDPSNLAAPGNAAAIATATDWFQFGRAINTMVNSRIVADGPLFKLPGGDVRVAVGAEYDHEKYEGITTRGATAASIAALPDTVVSRTVKSVFGEINVPIVGADNRGFIYGLSLTASARYDKYSDFGSTFNPKFGVNFEPVEWLRLRGNWGKAFQAPGLADLAQATAQSVTPLNTAQRPFFDPATPVPALGHNGWIIAFGGTIPGLKPQKAKTWSLGFDIKPAASSFRAGMTYYNIDFKGLIGIAPIFQPTFYRNFADHAVLYTAGDAAMQAYFNTLAANVTPAQAASALAAVGGNFSNVYSVLDGRTTNLSAVQTSGLDFYARYIHDTHFGDIYADIAGTYILTLKQGGTTGTISVNGIDPNNRFKVNTTVGTHIGNFQAQVTWAHNAGFKETPTAANLQQSRVSGFDLFNLFFEYKVPGESAITRDLSFTLNVDNVFDKDPPLLHGLSNSLFGAGNGFTLGRVVKFGISKKF